MRDRALVRSGNPDVETGDQELVLPGDPPIILLILASLNLSKTALRALCDSSARLLERARWAVALLTGCILRATRNAAGEATAAAEAVSGTSSSSSTQRLRGARAQQWLIVGHDPFRQ